jgi:hypothetical protein
MQQGGDEVLWSGILQQNRGNIKTYKGKIKYKTLSYKKRPSIRYWY